MTTINESPELEIGYTIKDFEIIDGLKHIKKMDLLEVSFPTQSDFDQTMKEEIRINKITKITFLENIYQEAKKLVNITNDTLENNSFNELVDDLVECIEKYEKSLSKRPNAL